MNDDPSPAASLAQKIGTALTEARLMRDERQADLTAKIAAGEISAADWKTEIDIAVDKAAKS
jgi:hypothetical protein